MECSKCHLIYKKEVIKTFTCGHIICKICFYNFIIKDLINNIDDKTKIFTINCKKCNHGTINFTFEELKNVELPSNFEEKLKCDIHKEILQLYDKNNKMLLCSKCNDDPQYKEHEKVKIEELKLNIKEKTSDLKYKNYEEFQKYIKNYFENFVESSKKYYQQEILKMELLIEKIKYMENNIKKQMEDQIEKEKVLFDLIDAIYKKNYENLKIINSEDLKDKTYGYRFYKQISKVKFDFGEFCIEHQEEIIPEFDKILKDFEENISKKKFKTNIKYPYFELIKSFSQTNDYKQDSIISCIASNKNINELSVGYRDYSIKIFQGSNYDSCQIIKEHKGEISSLLYIDKYLVSGSKDKTLKIWGKKIEDNSYILKQTLKIFDKEIKKLNIYTNDIQIGFLETGEESSFRLFLKKQNKEKNNNSMEVEEKEKKEGEKTNKSDIENKNLEEIFEIKQVLNEHDSEVNEAIQIMSNNDIISGSKDMTLIVWKDHMNCLGYESDQIISAGNEVQALCPFGNKGFAFAVNGSYEIKIYELNPEECQYESVCILNEEFCHTRAINQIILLKDNRLASCSYDTTVKILSFNSLTKELREDQELEEQDMPVNCIVETGNGKLISGGHSKHLIIYKRS